MCLPRSLKTRVFNIFLTNTKTTECTETDETLRPDVAIGATELCPVNGACGGTPWERQAPAWRSLWRNAPLSFYFFAHFR